jgi:RNA polymerase sigma-54 factor
MDLLHMPLLDLLQHLKTELEANPFLEMDEGEDLDAGEATEERSQDEGTGDEGGDETDWEEFLLDGFTADRGRMPAEQMEVREPVAVETPDLADHLWDQLFLLEVDQRQLFLCEELIGNIDDDGYLRATLEEVVEGANQRRAELAAEDGGGSLAAPFVLAEAKAALAVMQRLDPPGIAARDLRECLLLQLVEQGAQDSLAFRLVVEAFDDVVGRRWNDLAKRFALSPKAIQDAADELARLDPKPGLQYSGTGEVYVLPDLIVEKVDGEYRIFLNDGGMPRLRISPIYRELAADKKRFEGENREFVTQRLNNASWLIQAIEQRRQTMLRVMHFIVDRQREFFEKGVEYLKPLTLREVADVLELHESTISRVTSQKHVQTPRGLFPLKYFFSSSLGTTTGEDASSRAVKALIAKLVGDEDTKRPLTDAAIVTLLERRGVRIARRTVAKYREQLGILPARMRKRV